MSVMSDKIIIESINVKAPEITVEGGLKDNNLTKIQNNVNALSGSPSAGGDFGSERLKEEAPSDRPA